MGRRRCERTFSQMKAQLTYRKPLCPFICSTFQDFQEERDFLVKKVFSQIDALCRERGTYCAPVDLRWGINDAQVKSGQVVTSCLDYVTKCAPFFVCLLGERYGSHRPPGLPPLPRTYKDLAPDAHWVDKNLVIAASSGYDWVLTERYQNCSVTELECSQRASLASEFGEDFSFYYFRQPGHVDKLFVDLPEEVRNEKLKPYEAESEECRQKVLYLKGMIVRRGLTVKYFSTPEELGRMVLKDWKAVVDLLYPPLYASVEDEFGSRIAEYMAHEAFCETRRRIFVKTPQHEKLFADLTQFAMTALDKPPVDSLREVPPDPYSFSSFLRKKSVPDAKYNSVMLLVGDRGCGKTSVLANWLSEFEETYRKRVSVFAHYVGSTAQSTDVAVLMRRCTQELRDDHPVFRSSDSDASGTPEDMTEFHHICEAFQAALSMGPCLLVIDGVDEMGDTLGLAAPQVKEINWLPNPLPPQCKVIVTSARSDASYKALSGRKDVQVWRVPLLTDATAKAEVIKEYLAVHCKCLDDEQLERIVGCKLSDRPLFLAVLANELRMFGVYSRLDYHLESYLEASSIRELWSKIIQRWIRDYGWTKDEPNDTKDSERTTIGLEGWVADVLRLISVSRHGLSPAEIFALTERLGYRGEHRVTGLDWALFCSAAMDSLVDRPRGLKYFFHQHFKEAVEHTLFVGSVPNSNKKCKVASAAAEEDLNKVVDPNAKVLPCREEFHKHLADYFLAQEHSDRRTEELPYQMERAGELDGLQRVLTEPRIFQEMMGGKLFQLKRIELLHYWNVLRSRGYSPAAAHWTMLNSVSGKQRKGSQLRVHIADGPHSEAAMSVKTIEASDGSKPMPRIPRIIKTLASSDNDIPSAIDKDNDLYHEGNKSSNGSPPLSESEMQETQHVKDPDELAKITTSAGQLLAFMGYFLDSETMLLSAHKKLTKNFSTEWEYMMLQVGLEEALGNVYRFQSRTDEAASWYTRALATVDELLVLLFEAEDEQKLMETKGRLQDQLGHMHTCNHDYHAAEKMLMRAKRSMENAASVTGGALVKYHLAFLRMRQGQFEEADMYFSKSLSVLEKWYGKSHPRVADVLNDMAELYCNEDNQKTYDPSQGEYVYRRSLSIREQCFGSDNLYVATSLFNLGNLLRTQKSPSAWTEAISLMKRALDVRTTKLGANHPLTREVRNILSGTEFGMKVTRAKTAVDSRTDEHPYSALTWHEKDLEVFARRAAMQSKQRRQAYKADKYRQISLERRNHVDFSPTTRISMSMDNLKSLPEPAGGVSSIEIVDEESVEVVDDDDDQSGGEEATDMDRRLGILASAQDLEEAKCDFSPATHSVTIKLLEQEENEQEVEYLDGFAADVSRSLPSGSELGMHRPKKESISLLKRYSSAPPQGRTDRYRKSLSSSRELTPGKRRLHSAPVGSLSRHRPSSAMAMHKKHCSIPGPHTIDIHNVYSVMCGPHSSIRSLLGPRECPRSTVTSDGVHHTSAWYHVPGRYPTIETPYPPKRLQCRATTPRRSSFGEDPVVTWAGDVDMDKHKELKHAVRLRAHSEPPSC